MAAHVAQGGERYCRRNGDQVILSRLVGCKASASIDVGASISENTAHKPSSCRSHYRANQSEVVRKLQNHAYPEEPLNPSKGLKTPTSQN
eukprot:2533123-Amphidinium_carterae.1